ncbi:MAG: hypothetical protein OZ921_00250 [Sorangiineae bacterium]|nr:hypothetical protein [Polyangiaceae bacterium]MEB2320914.1 hypothetical protein [Sorangiineae bacterium]
MGSARLAVTTLGSVALACFALLACKKGGPAPAPSASAAPSAAPVSFEEQVKQSAPLAFNPAPQTAAGKTVQATLCKFPGAGLLDRSASKVIQALEVVGERLLVVDAKGVLHGFKLSTTGGCTLTVDGSFGAGGTLTLERPIEHLSKADSGLVMASGIFGSYALEDGRRVYDCKATGDFELAASGKWGIVPWVNSTVEYVELTRSSCKSKDWALKDLSDAAKRKGPFTNVNTAAIVGDKIYLGGVLAEKVEGREPRVVIIFDKAGRELGRFGDPGKGFGDDSFGWVHGIAACGKNLCVVDSNFRRMSIWSTDGKRFIGAVKLDRLFGSPNSVVWTNDVTRAQDGALYISAGVSRTGGKVAEGHVFRVTGL